MTTPDSDSTVNPAPDGPGTLHIVGTPIGNLGDLSLRAARTLTSSDAVICEDSRRAGRLLSHVAEWLSPESVTPRPRLIVANEHTEVARAAEIIGRLDQGEHLALITDAGMPAVSDPGARLVRAVVDAGHKVDVIPGPTAVSAAVALSGLDATRFVFEGFLPRKGAERSQRLAEVAGEARATVIYEAPHRIRRTIDDLVVACGPDRPVAVGRELTKLHEEMIRGPLAEVAERLATTEPRGEYVIVVAARPATTEVWSDEDLVQALTEELDRGSTRRDAVAAVVARTGARKRTVYDLVNQVGVGNRPDEVEGS